MRALAGKAAVAVALHMDSQGRRGPGRVGGAPLVPVAGEDSPRKRTRRPTRSLRPPRNDIVVNGLVRQGAPVEVAAEVGRQVPVLEDMRGDVTMRLGCDPDAPAGEE